MSVYLDYNASAPIDERVLDNWELLYEAEKYINSSGQYRRVNPVL